MLRELTRKQAVPVSRRPFHPSWLGNRFKRGDVAVTVDARPDAGVISEERDIAGSFEGAPIKQADARRREDVGVGRAENPREAGTTCVCAWRRIHLQQVAVERAKSGRKSG